MGAFSIFYMYLMEWKAKLKLDAQTLSSAVSAIWTRVSYGSVFLNLTRPKPWYTWRVWPDL